MNRKSLSGSFADWTDWDWAGYELRISLSLMTPEPAFGRAKHIFWTNHPIGEMLYRILDELVEVGILEKRENPHIQCRWSPTFKGSWE